MSAATFDPVSACVSASAPRAKASAKARGSRRTTASASSSARRSARAGREACTRGSLQDLQGRVGPRGLEDRLREGEREVDGLVVSGRRDQERSRDLAGRIAAIEGQRQLEPFGSHQRVCRVEAGRLVERLQRRFWRQQRLTQKTGPLPQQGDGQARVEAGQTSGEILQRARRGRCGDVGPRERLQLDQQRPDRRPGVVAAELFLQHDERAIRSVARLGTPPGERLVNDQRRARGGGIRAAGEPAQRLGAKRRILPAGAGEQQRQQRARVIRNRPQRVPVAGDRFGRVGEPILQHPPAGDQQLGAQPRIGSGGRGLDRLFVDRRQLLPATGAGQQAAQQPKAGDRGGVGGEGCARRLQRRDRIIVPKTSDLQQQRTLSPPSAAAASAS